MEQVLKLFFVLFINHVMSQTGYRLRIVQKKVYK